MHLKLIFQTIVCLLSIKSFSTKIYEDLNESEAIDRIDNISKCDGNSLLRKKIVCFYRVEDEFRPYDLDPCLCTHIVYSYVAVRENYAFIAGKKGDLKYLSALKQQNPNLKILVSLRPSSNQFILEETGRTDTTSLAVKSKFAKRVREFITRHALDGIDMDWEYFKEAQNQNTKRQTLISVLRILSNELKPLNESEESHHLLTITASKYARDLADYYDFSEIYNSVDFVNVPAFNFDTNPSKIIHPSRLHGLTDMENMDSLIDLVLALGLPQEQLIVGVPAHGTLYKLLDTSQTEPGAPASAWNNEEVIISHSKICGVRDNTNWTLVRGKDLTAPYVHYKDKWIGFDDEISIKLKAKYAVLRGVGGLALWSLNDDDSSGKCGYGPFPLLHTIRSVFLKPIENINYNTNTTFDSNSDENRSFETSFVAVIEKYGNVERITDEESDDNQLSCLHSGYQRHPNDCSKFYRCIKFNQNDENHEKFQYNCPYGLIFDDRYGMCNWPSWSPPCLGSGEIVSTPKRRFVCPSYGYFQDPENCEFFYYCSDFGKQHLQSYQMKCPFDLAFDEDKLLCNWKWLVRGCGPVNPEDQIIRDLPELLNQNRGTDETVGDSNDKLMERSDYVDIDPSFAANDQNSNQNPNSDQKESKFRRITQFMTKFVGNIGNKLKSFWFTKMESRSDKQGNRWLTRVNQYMPKLQRKRPNFELSNERNKKYSTKQRMPFIADPLITIPILEIRPEAHNLRNNQNRVRGQTIKKTALNPNQKRDRNPINTIPLSALQDPNDLFHISSITKTVQKLQDIIPMRNRHHNKHNRPKEPLGMPSSIVEIKKPLKSIIETTQKSLRRPQKNSGIKSKFHFPSLEPLVFETLEELEMPQYLPKQMSVKPIPGYKKTNSRDQRPNYQMGGIVPQKEVLHFTPEQLNLDKIKVENKPQKKPLEPIRDNQMNLKNKDITETQINFHNIDSKLLDSLKYTLNSNDKNNYQTIHLANNPNKEIKVNVNKDLKPSVTQTYNSVPNVDQMNKDIHQMNQWLKHTSENYKIPKLTQIQDQLSDSQRFREIPRDLNAKQNQKINSNENQRPVEHKNQLNRQRNEQQIQNQKPLKPIDFGSQSVHHMNKHLPKVELIPPQQSLPQLKPKLVPKQQQMDKNNRHRDPSQPSVKFNSRLQPVIYWPNPQEFESTKITSTEQMDNKGSNRVPNQQTMQINDEFVNHRQNEFNDKRHQNSGNKQRIPEYSEDLNHKTTEQLDTSATINEHFSSHPHNQRLYDKPTEKLSSVQDIKHKSHIKYEGLTHNKEQEKMFMTPPVQHVQHVQDQLTYGLKTSDFDKITKEFPNLYQNALFGDNHKNEVPVEKPTPRPRIIFTAPSSPSTPAPSHVPSLDEEYIMLMLNNDQNQLNSTEKKKSIHELFKKTEGKLYNLETDNSRTLVALVPKSQTTPKPVYDSFPNLVSFNVTQPPVLIKFEIPRPKSEVFHSIVQKVKDEWLSQPFVQPVYKTQSFAPYIRHDYSNQYIPKETTTVPPYIPVTYQTASTPGYVYQQPPEPTVNANNVLSQSLYDSLQKILSQNSWNQHLSQNQPQTESSTETPETTTSTPLTTQSSVILEHIPVYGGYNKQNHTNSMPWPQNPVPWYQQMISYPAPINPYPQPMQPYMPPQAPNYPYYPMHTGYGYPNIPPEIAKPHLALAPELAKPHMVLPPELAKPHLAFQPQFLNPNNTQNSWYDFYSPPSESDTETTTTPITTTVIITTESPITSTTTQRTRSRNRPSFARRTTTKRPKTTLNEIKTEIPTESPFDMQKGNGIPAKPQIEVFIVDQNEDDRSDNNRDQSESQSPKQPEVTVDDNKEEIKEDKQDMYGFRNGVKPKVKPSEPIQRQRQPQRQSQPTPQPQPPRQSQPTPQPQPPPVQHQSPPEPQYVEPLPPVTEQTPKPVPQIIPVKDIEYEDEPEISTNGDLRGQRIQPTIATTKVDNNENQFDSNSYPGLRNITDTSIPESACTRPGLFQHPYDCNKFYECYWDKYINKFTLHSFECPVKLAFDSRIIGCGLPHDPTICVQY